MVELFENSEDPDLALHCLLITLLGAFHSRDCGFNP